MTAAVLAGKEKRLYCAVMSGIMMHRSGRVVHYNVEIGRRAKPAKRAARAGSARCQRLAWLISIGLPF
jgi:hypothetical protein